MRRGWPFLWVLLWSFIAVPPAGAGPGDLADEVAALPPGARNAAHEAIPLHRQLGWHGAALAELSRQTTALKDDLERVRITPDTQRSQVAVDQLEARSARLQTLFEAALEEAAAKPEIQTRLESVRGRLAEVRARIDEIVASPDPGERIRLAAGLRDELRGQGPKPIVGRRSLPTVLTIEQNPPPPAPAGRRTVLLPGSGPVTLKRTIEAGP